MRHSGIATSSTGKRRSKVRHRDFGGLNVSNTAKGRQVGLDCVKNESLYTWHDVASSVLHVLKSVRIFSSSSVGARSVGKCQSTFTMWTFT